MGKAINIYMPEEYVQMMNAFEAHYQPLHVVECPQKKPSLKPKHQRHCRFCDKNYESGVTTFKKDAHTIPQFFGNRYLINDFECDNCNHAFGQYENSLKNFLGIIPTLTKTKGSGNKLKNFQAPGKQIIAGLTNKLPIEGDFVEIIMPDADGQAFKTNFVDGFVRAEFNKNPYIPYDVYRSLLKIAFSCLNDEEIRAYQNALYFLRSTETLPKPFPTVYLTQTTITKGINTPLVFIFKKRIKTSLVPTHIAVLYYQNMIFQAFLPLHNDDTNLYNGHKIDLPICPPLNIQPDDKNNNYKFEVIDFSSSHSKNDELQLLSFNFDLPLEKMRVKDKQTGELIKPNDYPSDIIGCVIVPSGVTIPKEL